MRSTHTQVPFEELPDDARLWVFASPRPLEPAEARTLLARVDAFLEGWHAHGHPVVGGRDWRDDRFLFVAADERATGVSGCSIDALFRALKEAEPSTGASLLDRSLVYYRDDDGEVRAVPRPEFRTLAEEGEISESTCVFDTTISTVGQLRDGRWEVHARESWHRNLTR